MNGSMFRGFRILDLHFISNIVTLKIDSLQKSHFGHRLAIVFYR